jgi:hypothetical protein
MEDLPTNSVGDAAREEARKARQRVEQQGREQPPPPKGVPDVDEAPIETLPQLFSKLFWGGGESEYDEINDFTPTGYCNEEELRLMREYEEMISIIRYLEERYNLDLTGVKNTFMRKMNFIAYSSKSRRGFTVKSVNTQRHYVDENVFQESAMGDDKKFMEKLKKKLLGGGGRRQMEFDGVLPDQRNVYDNKSRERELGGWM